MRLRNLQSKNVSYNLENAHFGKNPFICVCALAHNYKLLAQTLVGVIFVRVKLLT